MVFSSPFRRLPAPPAVRRGALKGVTFRAFTLIELLIVVAIIAILAAIAVPNFLEAQTRAKTSRVKSDMRSLATALESYRVDSNQYPYGDGTGDGFTAVAGTRRLTTPIAYMTTIPIDVFSPDPNTAPSAGAFIHPYSPAFFYVSSRPGGFPGIAASAGTWGWLVVDYRVNALAVAPNTVLGAALANESENVFWELRSLGPDREGNSSFPYDPTNGTISSGDVTLFGPGNSGKNGF
ncbi:MAG: prepilin-type N-terminal cleavage/methylation domain-containing protein [Sumerlaeia bacterium]